jgi:RNA-binding protein
MHDMKKLTGQELRKLKGMAQRREPVVRVGKQGLTDAFIKSLDEALSQHELVKVKFADLKEQKKELSPLLAEKTGSHLVMRVGNVVVLYREHPDPDKRSVLLRGTTTNSEGRRLPC